jgi:hypothetical protein
VGAGRGTTTGPGSPLGATWMWAALAGAISLTRRTKQIWFLSVLMWNLAVPEPSGSPGMGASSAPVMLTVKVRVTAAAGDARAVDPARVRAAMKRAERRIIFGSPGLGALVAQT